MTTASCTKSLGLIRTDNVCLWQSSGSREPMEMLSAEVLPPDELLHARERAAQYFLALGLPRQPCKNSGTTTARAWP